MATVDRLRVHAISQSLFPPTTLKTAVLDLFKPIPFDRRLARNLILHHRVREYRAGDLERRYAWLDIEEDVLYAYGFLPRAIWQLLHPRNLRGRSKLEKRVLDVVREFGAMHPKELETHFGNARVINGWGGYSKATHALDHLHYRGVLRIARRERGIRICPTEGAPPLSVSEGGGRR